MLMVRKLKPQTPFTDISNHYLRFQLLCYGCYLFFLPTPFDYPLSTVRSHPHALLFPLQADQTFLQPVWQYRQDIATVSLR